MEKSDNPDRWFNRGISRREVLLGARDLLLTGTGLAALVSNAEAKPRRISDQTIDHYMRMNSAYEILRGVNVEYARSDGHGGSNLLELVNRTDKPKLVYFTDHGSRGIDFSKRGAIVLKDMARTHSQLVDFIVYDTDNGVGEIRLIGLRKLPSYALFIPTERRNQPWDIMRGGPRRRQSVGVFSDNISYWIEMNLDPRHEDFRQYRLNNSDTWHKVQP